MAEKSKWDYLFKEVSPLTLSKKRRNGICKHYGCKRPARGNKWDCETCHSRLSRIKNPVRYAFATVKESARKRHIPFQLSLAEFTRFCEHTGYIESKGKEFESLTIDRIRSEDGYQMDNIRALTWIENCRRSINGMTDPCEPIAKAMAMMKEDKNWHRYKKLAVNVLNQVELLQAQNEGGFQNSLEDEDRNPF